MGTDPQLLDSGDAAVNFAPGSPALGMGIQPVDLRKTEPADSRKEKQGNPLFR